MGPSPTESSRLRGALSIAVDLNQTAHLMLRLDSALCHMKKYKKRNELRIEIIPNV